MAGKKLRTLLMCALSIMLCISAVAVGTYALFTDKVTVNNHLQAGTLQVALTRTELSGKKLGADGYLDDVSDTTEKDFTGSTTATDNVFGIGEHDLIVPGCKYTAKMKLKNLGSVALSYTVQIVLNTPSAENDNALARQLKISFGKTEATSTSKTLAEVGTESIGNGTIAAGENSADEFIVSIEFVGSDNNNDAKSGEVSFDIVVLAVQQTTAPSAGN